MNYFPRHTKAVWEDGGDLDAFLVLGVDGEEDFGDAGLRVVGAKLVDGVEHAAGCHVVVVAQGAGAHCWKGH